MPASGYQEHEEPRFQRCTAWSKRKKARCNRWAMRGKEVCVVHGGKTPTGIHAPQFRHGRYSRVLAGKLLKDFTLLLTDEKLLELHDDVSLVTLRIQELLSRVDVGDTRDRWHQVQRSFWRYHERRNTDEAFTALGELRDVIMGGVAESGAWHEIVELIDQRRKLVEAEARRKQALGLMLEKDRAVALIAYLAASVRTHVKDDQAIRRIASDITHLGVPVPAQETP
jgi:hypothetical protein